MHPIDEFSLAGGFVRNTNTAIDPNTESSILRTGEDILKRMETQSKSSIFNKDWWYGAIMDWSMKNPRFKTNMFRFVDVLPALHSGNEVAKHLKEYFTEGGEELPSVFNVGLGLGKLAPGLMAGAIRKNVTEMAKMFITGETPKDALNVLKKTRKNKITFTVDILGEATLSEKEALEYQGRYMELISWLAKESKDWESIPLIDKDHMGDIPKINVSVKMTALYSQIKDSAWDESKLKIKERLRPLFRLAQQNNVFLNLDMEQYSVKHLTLEVYKELLMEPEFRSYKHFGCVIQAYLRDSLSDIQDLIDFAKSRATPFTVRLVKGAYWDYETVEAQQRDWPIPVYLKKSESDANYEVCAEELMKNHAVIRVALGSHNVRTISAAIVSAQKYNVPKEAFEIQMLYGMADPIKKSLVDMGYRVREYAPVGDLIPGMAYLVRRLLENTSNESWLRGKFAEGKTTAELLKNPLEVLNSQALNSQVLKSQALNSEASTANTIHVTTNSKANEKVPATVFKNEALLDFAVSRHRQSVDQAIQNLKSKLPIKVLPYFGGKEVAGTSVLDRVNPSATSEIVAQISLASVEQAETAIQIAQQSFKTWKYESANKRADLLDRLADMMVRDRYSLIATQILEVGKPWAEADGDVAEAIDFCRYYAQDFRKISKGEMVGNIPGESSWYHYQPRGVAVVIAPWNFPLAILCGMAVGAAVTGNTVIMKPAEQSSLVAKGLMDLMIEAGFPAGVVQFLPGLGEVVGEYLVQHPLTATIAFTGSKTVGLHILNAASTVKPGQKHVKRCMIEMGGKNAVIIDNDADLDEAVDGVLYSAFGFSGQKCSAASRVIVLDEVYDKFVQRLVEAARSIEQKPAIHPKAYFGPVVDADAYQRIMNLVATYKNEYQLLFEGEKIEGGYFVPAVIFGDVNPASRLAQEEIFGPVVAVIRAKDLESAIEIANSTEYALTGGLFSRSPVNIQKVREQFECGNLYINRGITGAMVDRHPFGGFKMSGIGSKTGGPDYLKQFMEPRVVTENLMRRGFTPES